MKTIRLGDYKITHLKNFEKYEYLRKQARRGELPSSMYFERGYYIVEKVEKSDKLVDKVSTSS